MRLTEVGTPVTTTNGQNAELGNDDSSANGGSDFLGGLDSETDVALTITDDNNGLETGTLTGTGLLLDRLDLLVKLSALLDYSINLQIFAIEPGPLNQLCRISLLNIFFPNCEWPIQQR